MSKLNELPTCPVCLGARWACEHVRIENLTQIEVLTKDNRILSDAVDSLRDLTTEQGLTISRALKRITDLETEVAFLRTRVSEPAPPAILWSGSSHIDPSGPGWGG